jgi:hypothetical protein
LLESLFTHRMLQMEGQRGKMLERAEKADLLGDIRTLMDVICLPHVDLKDADGRYNYAEFLTQYLFRYRPPLGPLTDPPEPPAPLHLFHVQKLIRERLAYLPEEVFVRRLVTAVMCFLTVLVNHKSFEMPGREKGRLETALADTLDQISVALVLPFRG